MCAGKGREMTPDERDAKILRLHQKDGLDTRTIADRMGLRPARIRSILNQMGVDTSRKTGLEKMQIRSRFRKNDLDGDSMK